LGRRRGGAGVRSGLLGRESEDFGVCAHSYIVFSPSRS
jgi:hypothetical protein